MGAECFTTCSRYKGTMKPHLVTNSRHQQAEVVTVCDIECNLRESASLGHHLSTKLNKNRNLRSECRFFAGLEEIQNGRASKVPQSFSMLRLTQDDPLEVSDQPTTSESITSSTKRRKIQTEHHNSAELQLSREDQPERKLQSLQRIEETKQDGSTLWPHRNFQFLRKDFLRIVKANPTSLYTFKTKLGEGSQGTVYWALEKRTQEQRAIKVIRKDSLSSQHNFFAEFEILNVLDHPNIVKLYEIIEHNNFYYLVMEYCEGGQVLPQVKRLKRFSQRSVAAIMRHIMAAVVYIHDNNIIHRDLKLENMVFEHKVSGDEDDLPPPIKLIDFGTCKFLKTKQNQTLKTPAGTPMYMAPQVLNDRYNNKCDVWSCGVIMYILLSGRAPFRGYNRKSVFTKIQFQPVAFTGTAKVNKGKIWQGISEEAKQLIRSMLEKNSKFRASALQVLHSNWIQNCSDRESISLKVLSGMEHYYFKDKFVAVVLTYLASNAIPQSRRRGLAKQFMKIDSNQSGVIEKTELIKVYRKKNPEMNEQRIEAIFKNIDTDNSGKIDFTEFLVVAEKQEELLQKEHLERAFAFFNTSKSGYLSLDEVRAAIDEENDLEALRIIEELDTDKDQRISKQEFVDKMLKYCVN